MTITVPEPTTEFGFMVDQFANASETLKQNSAEIVQGSWLSFEAWYDAAAVAVLAKQMSDVSIAAQQTSAGLAAEYASQVVALVSGGPVVSVGRLSLPPIRNGVDLKLVHTRPAEAYKRAIATGSTHEQALVKAGIRAAGLALTDISLEQRAAQQATLARAGVTEFRRVIHPELSQTGTCGLCIVSADRIYSTSVLMPIHPPSCKCTIAPIIDGNDPGHQLNREDLDALYAAAGSTKAADLARTRYKVHEHGEFGPVIAKAEDTFRGPSKVGLENDPERAARMLDKALPVLTALEQRANAGESVDGPLEYQRGLVAKLRRIVGS